MAYALRRSLRRRSDEQGSAAGLTGCGSGDRCRRGGQGGCAGDCGGSGGTSRLAGGVRERTAGGDGEDAEQKEDDEEAAHLVLSATAGEVGLNISGHESEKRSKNINLHTIKLSFLANVLGPQ